jgi:hypothetical protein
MNRTITIAPVRKSIVVQAGTERALNVFTAAGGRRTRASVRDLWCGP